VSAGRRALITGATSQIGRSIARALATDGYQLLLTGRRADVLSTLASELNAKWVAGDLTTPALREQLASGPAFHALVHSAGHTFTYARHHDFAAADEAALHEVDYRAGAALARLLVPGMMKQRAGRFVFIGSLAATFAGGGSTPYAATKAAVEGLSRGLATDYGRFGITSNVVALGVIETERTALRMTDERRRAFAAATSLRRIGQPTDVAGPVRFLCSDEAAYITGTTLVVSGGLHLNQGW